MMRSIKYLLLPFVAVVLLVACRSTKTVIQEAGSPTSQSKKEPQVEWAHQYKGVVSQGTLTAKLNLQLNMGTKNLSVGGSYNLKKDELVQLSLVALGFMEVGRLELTPHYIMLINRVEREYVKVRYDEIPYLQQAGVDFYTLQALFWNDIFEPGSGSSSWTPAHFKANVDGDKTILSPLHQGLVRCLFTTILSKGILESTAINVVGKPQLPTLIFSYNRFTSVGDQSFPSEIQMRLEGGTTRASALFLLSNLRHNAKQVEPTAEPGGRYKRVEAKDILNKLIK